MNYRVQWKVRMIIKMVVPTKVAGRDERWKQREIANLGGDERII